VPFFQTSFFAIPTIIFGILAIPSAYNEYNANNSGHPVILVIALIVLIAAVVVFCLLYFKQRSANKSMEKQIKKTDKENHELILMISNLTKLKDKLSVELKNLWQVTNGLKVSESESSQYKLFSKQVKQLKYIFQKLFVLIFLILSKMNTNMMGAK